MAKNTGEGYRKGSVNDRVQDYNPRRDTYTKIDTNSGGKMSSKSGSPYKGIAKNPDGRRTK